MTQQTATAPATANGPPESAEAIPLPPVPTDLCLAERLAGVAAEVKAVAKSGRNAHFGYSYQRAEDIAASVAPVLARYGVAITPRIEHQTVSSEVTGQTKAGADIRLYTVPMVFRVACRGEADDVPWLAQATDDSDKGINKAITAALKSFLRAQFLIPTGEDDTDSGATTASGGRREWSGELPPVDAGAFTGSLEVNSTTGDIGIRFRTTSRDDQAGFDLARDTAKKIGGRWNGEDKLWVVPAHLASQAVAFAAHFGLAIPSELEATYPADAGDAPPPDAPPGPGTGDGAAWDNFDAGARAQAAAARGESDDRRPSSDDDIPF